MPTQGKEMEKKSKKERCNSSLVFFPLTSYSLLPPILPLPVAKKTRTGGRNAGDWYF